MALNLPDFGNTNWKQPYETYQKGRNTEQDIITKELDNVFKRITNETAGEKNRADINNTKAQTGLFGEQTKWYGPKSQAEIGYHNAQASKAAQDAMETRRFLEMLGFGGAPGAQGPQPTVAPGANAGGGAAPSMQQPQAQGTVPASAPLAQQGQQNQEVAPQAQLLRDAWLRHKLNTGHIQSSIGPDNRAVQFDPLTGQYKIQDVGLPSAAQLEGEKAEASETGKANAQEKEKVLNTIDSALSQQPIFDELMELVNSDEFYKGTGPVSSRIRKLTDDPKVNEMAGKLNYLLGDVVNKASKQFGARLNKSEYDALTRMKGSDSQNPYEIKSKVLLMNALNKFTKEVNTNYYNNLKTMGRLEAKEKAYQDSNYGEIRNIVKMDDLAHKAAKIQKSNYGAVMKAAERFSKETGVPLEQALNELGRKNG